MWWKCKPHSQDFCLFGQLNKFLLVMKFPGNVDGNVAGKGVGGKCFNLNIGLGLLCFSGLQLQCGYETGELRGYYRHLFPPGGGS